MGENITGGDLLGYRELDYLYTLASSEVKEGREISKAIRESIARSMQQLKEEDCNFNSKVTHIVTTPFQSSVFVTVIARGEKPPK